MNASEIMDCQDLIDDIDYIAECMRASQFDEMADDLHCAADKLANLVERLRVQ